MLRHNDLISFTKKNDLYFREIRIWLGNKVGTCCATVTQLNAPRYHHSYTIQFHL